MESIFDFSVYSFEESNAFLNSVAYLTLTAFQKNLFFFFGAFIQTLWEAKLSSDDFKYMSMSIRIIIIIKHGFPYYL